MTVPTEVSYVEYTGNGATTVFPVPFPFLEDEHLVVTLTPSGGSQSTLTLNVDYTVAGAGEEDGSITMAVAPAAAAELLIERTLPLTQETAFRTAGTFSPGTHEDVHDECRMIDQQLDRRISALEGGSGGGGSGPGFGAIPVNVTKAAASEGASSLAARADHKHDVTTAAPSTIHDSLNNEGSASSLSRSDHQHSHGTRGGGDLHALADASTAGFMGPDDKRPVGGQVSYTSDEEYDPTGSIPSTQLYAAPVTQVIGFENIILNDGDAFDTPSRFVAPLDGRYFLHAELTLQREASPGTDEWAEVYFRKNGTDVLQRRIAMLAGDGRWWNPTLALTVALQRDDYVEVVIRLLECDYTLIGGLYSTFGGHLLRAD